MARNGLLGKLLAVCACGAAIGGVCYIYKDKLKESKLYEDLHMDDKLMTLRNLFASKKDEDEADFIDEDEYIFETDEDVDVEAFSEDAGRSYVSLQTDPAGETTTMEEDAPVEDAAAIEEDAPVEDAATIEDTVVPTISLQEEAGTDDNPADENGVTPSGYDMEGLSDVSEDPDVLIEMTRLDDTPSDFL